MSGIAVLYVRQSRHKEGERTVSPEVQEEQCRQLRPVAACDQVELFTDLDISGGKRARRGYDALLARIRAGGVAVVAAYDQSRAFRSTLLAAEFKALLEEPPQARIQVVFVHGTFDRSPIGGFSYAVLAAAHEMERRMTGEKIREAYGHMNARGEATGMPPYGYQRIDGTLAIDEDQAAVVRRLFSDYAGGQASTRALAARLNAEGIKKPGSRTRGLGWVPDTIADLLQNIAYVGMTYSVSRARREGMLIDASWPSIVDRQLFDRVQAMMAKHRVAGRGGARRGETHAYAFAGLLECQRCGRPMHALTSQAGAYYYCRRDVATDHRCAGAQRSVREGRLLPWATLLFERIDALRPDDFDRALSKARRRPTSPDALAQVEKSVERQRKLFTWGHISEADYLREAARLKELREQLRGALPTKRSLRVKGILDLWQRGDEHARRQLLGNLFERLVVRDGEIVEYVPRADRAAEVIALVEQAVGTGGAINGPREYGWRAKGRPRRIIANGGKGGIRTLEGVSHPLPA